MCSNLESHWKSKKQRENVGSEQARQRTKIRAALAGAAQTSPFQPFEQVQACTKGYFPVCELSEHQPTKSQANTGPFDYESSDAKK